MFHRAIKFGAFFTLLFFYQASAATTINILKERASLYTQVGYSKFPNTYSASYTGTSTVDSSLFSAAVLVSEMDEEGNDIITGSALPGASGMREEANVFARANGGLYGNMFYYDVSNNSSVWGSASGPENEAALDSVFAQSYISLDLMFEVTGGDSGLFWDFSELEGGFGVSAEFYLEDLTEGIILGDILAHSSSGNRYALLDNHTYRLSMAIDNVSTDDSASALSLDFFDTVAMAVPEPGALPLLGLSLFLMLLGPRIKRYSEYHRGSIRLYRHFPIA